MHNVKHAQVFS